MVKSSDILSDNSLDWLACRHLAWFLLRQRCNTNSILFVWELLGNWRLSLDHISTINASQASIWSIWPSQMFINSVCGSQRQLSRPSSLISHFEKMPKPHYCHRDINSDALLLAPLEDPHPSRGTLIFLCKHRLGSFFWVQNFIFQYFLGFSEKNNWGMKILWIFFGGHQKIGLYLVIISMHFKVFSSRYRIWDIFLVCQNFKYFFGCLDFLIFLGWSVDAAPDPTFEEKMRVPPPPPPPPPPPVLGTAPNSSNSPHLFSSPERRLWFTLAVICCLIYHWRAVSH